MRNNNNCILNLNENHWICKICQQCKVYKQKCENCIEDELLCKNCLDDGK